MQETFILASSVCKENIKSLCIYWGLKKDERGYDAVSAPKGIKVSVPAMFQTLFLLVPVISVTFASVGSFFKNLGAGDIGTLIVDEAGQAVPYMALGALYRAKKAIIVGDPRQVEPVVTDDLKLFKQAYEKDPVCRYYISKDMSVQTFADSLNKYGTWLGMNSKEGIWVGCPLVVHRRCISPMFEISNELSYNNIMKQKTSLPGKKEQEKFLCPESGWIEVKGRESGGKNHFVACQAEKVLELLELAIDREEEDNIYIISPFKSVVEGMKTKLERSGADKSSKLYRLIGKNWSEGHIGTVHTFQGKEADEVIFLLGCDISKQASGAIRWVGKNIVNVAVTRAKYRLYVVGDVEAWRFSEPMNIVLQNLKKL